MLNILADTMMIATRTNTHKRAFDLKEEDKQYIYSADRRRREEKLQLNQALARGLLK